MKVKISIDGISKKRIDNFIETQPRAFSKAVKTGLLRVGLDIRNAAGTKAPFKTGTLRRSLTQKTNSAAIYDYAKNGGVQQVAVGSNLVYARIQEFGGRAGRGHAVKIRARRFLRPPFEVMKRGKGSKILGEEIENAIDNL